MVEIARALGVPPTLMMDFGRATWSNAEEMSQVFLAFTILPRTKMWSGAVARLLSKEEQATYYAEFMVDELVKADIAARFVAYSQAIAARILSPNEVRAKENMPPYEGGDEFANPNITPRRRRPFRSRARSRGLSHEKRIRVPDRHRHEGGVRRRRLRRICRRLQQHRLRERRD
ncbi:MAG: phage portal protein [Bauldia sp.]